MGQRLVDLLEQMGSKAAAVQHEVAARDLDPTKLTSEKILAGENPAGTSVSVKIPHDALVIVHAVGDTMFPHNQNPPTALQIQIEGYRTSPRAGANQVWKDLPEPLSKPKREIRIRAATASAYTVSKGDYIQIIDVAGRQCSDFIAFDFAALAAGEELEIDATTTRTLMGATTPGPGLHSKFFNARMQPMVETIRDTVGRHDTFMLACSAKYYDDIGYPGHVLEQQLRADRVDGHAGRGGAAFVLKHTPEGDQIVLRHGPRTMPVLYTHLVPATFGGKARMNVANALAAAAAAWAAGAHLHDIRQGLRTFTTSFFQAPGRLNLVEVGGVRVVIDYCHNVDGMRNLADFVNRMMVENGIRDGRAIGVIGVPGDRRDDDMRDYGGLAAGAFDEIIVREDRNLRGRAPGETAAHVLEGIRLAKSEGGRTQRSQKILDEMTAVRSALRRANPGDLLVMCVDDAIGVYRETMAAAGQGLGTTAFADPGEMEAPEG